MIRVVGVLLALLGLILVGMSGDNQRVPNGRRLIAGMVAMVIGALIAIFATQVGFMMGWQHP